MKKRNKLKPLDEVKIQARFDIKYEEFKEKSLDELKEIFNTIKMSNTDKQALITVVRTKQEEIMVQRAAELKEKENIDGE